MGIHLSEGDEPGLSHALMSPRVNSAAREGLGAAGLFRNEGGPLGTAYLI